MFFNPNTNTGFSVGTNFENTFANGSTGFPRHSSQEKLKQPEIAKLRITGSKAPSSEVIDHWKRHSADGFYQFVDRLVK